MESLLGAQRAFGGNAEGTWRLHGGCMEGYRMVARCVEGPMEWLLGAWRAHRVYMEGPMEWLPGAQRVCGGYRMVARCMGEPIE